MNEIFHLKYFSATSLCISRLCYNDKYQDQKEMFGAIMIIFKYFRAMGS